MSVARSLGIGVLVVLLTMSVIGANGVVAAEQTVLSAQFVKTTLEETDGYDGMEEAVVDAASEQVEEQPELPVAPTTLVDSAVTKPYLRTQTERNVDRLYAYLHGDRAELVIAFNLVPVKENLVETIEARIEETPLPELLSLVADEGTTTVTVQGVTMDMELIATMAANRSAYRTTRDEFRTRVRETVLDRLVNETMETASNDELLSLVIEDYDPTAYTADEKEAMVEEREAEIRNAIEQRIERDRGDELDTEIDRRLAEYNEEIKNRLETSIRETSTDLDPDVLNATIELLSVGVDGLTTDMSYSTFRTEVEDAKARLASAVAGLAEERLEEDVPDRMDLTGEMGSQTTRQLMTLRQAVGTADILLYVLPVIAVILVAGIYLVSGSVALTATGSGIALFAGGLLGVGAAGFLAPRIRAAIPGDLPGGLQTVITDLVERVFGLLQTQSLALLVLGIIVVGLGLALRYELLSTGRTDGA